MRRALILTLTILLSAGALAADTIVLRSGRRITATNVVEEGDRVYYETSAGRFSFSKSAVERIERGDDATFASGSSGKSDVQISVPNGVAVEGYDEIARATVKDGAIDREYVAQLETEAQRGGKQTSDRAAVAHYAAGKFQLNKGALDEAIAHYRRALSYSPDEVALLWAISYAHLRKSEYTQAIDYLERAKRIKPESPQTAKLLGWAHYGLNKIDLAVAEWKRALSIRPDPEVEAALAKAQRDQQEEASYREGESRHFQLRYHGTASPALAKEVLRTLETHFSAIESALNFTPPDPVGVILYTEEAFVDVTRAPGWAGALNDGRIRVPVEGLSSVTSELSRSLMHELVHSFVWQKTRGRCPVWLNEGIAQWLEGKRSSEQAGALVQIAEAKRTIPLDALEGYWTRLPEDVARFAYAWSLANVEYIIRTNGMGDIERLLERLPSESSAADALRSVLHSDYEDLQKETINYLKRTYVR